MLSIMDRYILAIWDGRAHKLSPTRIRDGVAYKLAVIVMLFMMIASFNIAQDDDPVIIAPGNTAELAELATLNGHFAAVQGLDFSPDSVFLASAGDDFTVRIWHIPSTAQRYSRELHAGFVKDVDFARLEDELLLASGSWDRLVQIISMPPDDPDAATSAGEVVAGSAVVDNVAFSLRDERLRIGLTVGSGHVALHEFGTYDEIARYDMPTLQGMALAFSPDGRYLAAASGFPSTAVSVFDTDSDTTAPVFTLDAENGTVTGLDFIPVADDESYILAAVDDLGGLHLWSIDDEAEIIGAGEHDDAWLLAVDVAPSGELLATSALDGRVHLWDVREADAPELLTTLDLETPINDLTFSPDGTLLALAGDDGVIYLWGIP